MSLSFPDSTKENIVLSEQQKVLNRLKYEVEQLQNSCTIQELDSGKLKVKIETYVIELIEGKLDEKAKVIPISKTVEISKDLIPFQYSKYQQDSWNLQIDRILKGQKESRETIPLFRINAPTGNTFLRLGHLYPNYDGSFGAKGGIFGLLPDYQNHENASRYFPDDSSEGLKDVNIEVITI